MRNLLIVGMVAAALLGATAAFARDEVPGTGLAVTSVGGDVTSVGGVVTGGPVLIEPDGQREAKDRPSRSEPSREDKGESEGQGDY